MHLQLARFRTRLAERGVSLDMTDEAITALADAGYDLTISIPSVVVGTDHSISRPRDIPCFEIPFETDALDANFKREVGGRAVLGRDRGRIQPCDQRDRRHERGGVHVR